MDDLFDELDQLSEVKTSLNSLNLSKNLSKSLEPLLNSEDFNWKIFYSRETALKTLDRIHLIAYHEPVDLFGLITVKGLSAGYSIGSCNWIINSTTEKVAYISHTSLLYSHVLPFDDREFLNADILVVGTVNMLASSQLEKTVEEFSHIVVQTLARGGHVLVPSNPCGIVFDLIETAFHSKDNFNGTIQPLVPHDSIGSSCSNSKSYDSYDSTNGSISISNSSSIGIGSNVVSDAPSTLTNAHSNTNNALGNNIVSTTTTTTNSSSSSSNIPIISLPATVSTNGSAISVFGTNNNINSNNLIPIGGSSLAGRVARSPVFLLSNQIHVSLAYANAYGEWLNPEKESLLYTADAPFPFQAHLQSGQLVALKSLHDNISNRKLGDSRPNSNYSGIANSPLLLGPKPSIGGHLDTLSTANLNNKLNSTLFALSNTTAANHDLQNILSGSQWPNVPCLIFSSHPSLRLGPVVHLIRALAHGSLRPGSKTALPIRHSIILIESGDYVPMFDSNCQLETDAFLHLKRLMSPYSNFTGTNNCNGVKITTPFGTPVLNLSDTASVYWLPMESRIGPGQLGQIIQRCGEPRIGLILPQEIINEHIDLSNMFENISNKIYHLTRGQKFCFNLSDNRCEPVRLTAKLASRIKPFHVNVQNNMDSDHSKLSESGTRVLKSKWKNSEDVESVEKELGIEKSLKRTCIALVDGILSTRDGEHWLADKYEKLNVNQPRKLIGDYARPSTPPTDSNCRNQKNYYTKSVTVDPESRIFVSQESSIDPHLFIQKLTERGVTGAYLADENAARQLYWRFSTCDQNANNDIILFPNPNILICLSDYRSHIITMDESTRTTIRDVILSFLQPIETRSDLYD